MEVDFVNRKVSNNMVETTEKRSVQASQVATDIKRAIFLTNVRPGVIIHCNFGNFLDLAWRNPFV